MGVTLIVLFLALFVLGFPVVYAILLPAILYVVVEGLPMGLLAQGEHLLGPDLLGDVRRALSGCCHRLVVVARCHVESVCSFAP